MSQARYDADMHYTRLERDVARAGEAQAVGWAREAQTRYEALLEKYHALRVAGANPAPVPAPVEVFPEPDVPPDAVLAAMQQISPVPDKTYQANWQYWEANKAKAAANPEAFAQNIIEGAVFGSLSTEA